MTNQPLVSIIIPTYNREHLIGETLDSVLAQTYQNWECIIVDDGSSDNTDEVVNEYVKKDSRFKYYNRPDEHLPGGNGARNYGFKMSQGEYVNWLDSDDLFSKDKIEKQMKVLSGEIDSISTCPWGRFKDLTKFKIKNLSIYKDFYPASDIFSIYGEGGFFPSHSFLCSRGVVEKSGFWNEKLLINQDGEFFCRVILNSKSIYFAKDTYILYRIDSTFKTSRLSSLLKAKASIISWKLIENNLIMSEVHARSYVQNAKNNIYTKIKSNYPELIRHNSDFFQCQIKLNSNMSRFKRKIMEFLK